MSFQKNVALHWGNVFSPKPYMICFYLILLIIHILFALFDKDVSIKSASISLILWIYGVNLFKIFCIMAAHAKIFWNSERIFNFLLYDSYKVYRQGSALVIFLLMVLVPFLAFFLFVIVFLAES